MLFRTRETIHSDDLTTPYRFLLHLFSHQNLALSFLSVFKGNREFSSLTSRHGCNTIRSEAAMDGSRCGLSHALGLGEGWV